MRDECIVDYRTIVNNPEHLDVHVNDAIKSGWQPYGPPAVTYRSETNSSNTIVMQVVVKYQSQQPTGGN